MKNCLRILGFTLWSLLAASAHATDTDRLAEVIPNYHQAETGLSFGGAPALTAMPDIKQAGVVNIIDFRTAREGTQAEQQAAEAAGLNYFNLPLGGGRPSAELVNSFAALMKTHANENTVLHCASGNRAATVWAFYRVQAGEPVESTITAALAAGMAPSRADWVREWAEKLATE